MNIMINIIHYDDDIFYLTYTVKRLSDGIKLELDAALFLNKILEDMAFVSRAVDFFLESLKSSKLKVNRLNYLKNMYKVNKLFVEMLNALLTEQAAFAQNMKSHFPQLQAMRDRHIEHEHTIRDAMHAGKHPAADEGDGLSEEEYRILLADNEEK
jgi:hypothetical protein